MNWNTEKTSNLLEILKNKANCLWVRKLASPLLNDPRFPLWSGSSIPYQHHYGTGGLIVHVSEVVDMCISLREQWYPEVDERVLFLSALMHDWGKLWDYQPVNVQEFSLITAKTEWTKTLHKRNIHHISRSAIEWGKTVALNEKYESIEDEVSHAILSHHGEREWGSPVSPNTHVAWLVHHCDAISARMNDCGKMDYVQFRKDN